MFKEIRFLIYVIVIIFFTFFTAKYYFSDTNKKKSFRALSEIDEKIKKTRLSLILRFFNVILIAKYNKINTFPINI